MQCVEVSGAVRTTVRVVRLQRVKETLQISFAKDENTISICGLTFQTEELQSNANLFSLVVRFLLGNSPPTLGGELPRRMHSTFRSRRKPEIRKCSRLHQSTVCCSWHKTWESYYETVRYFTDISWVFYVLRTNCLRFPLRGFSATLKR